MEMAGQAGIGVWSTVNGAPSTHARLVHTACGDASILYILLYTTQHSDSLTASRVRHTYRHVQTQFPMPSAKVTMAWSRYDGVFNGEFRWLRLKASF